MGYMKMKNEPTGSDSFLAVLQGTTKPVHVLGPKVGYSDFLVVFASPSWQMLCWYRQISHDDPSLPNHFKFIVY